jgi:enterochelin esterase-like enzyme
VFGPQGYVIFALLAVIFAAGVYAQHRTGKLALQIGAGVLSFVVAALFGMAAVNKFYDYYQTWGDLYNDVTGTQAGVTSLPNLPSHENLQKAVGGPDASRVGRLLSVQLPGPQSHISRTGLIYLPPQYFQSRYGGYRFPVVELIHGSPGKPYDWVGALHVTRALSGLITQHRAQPMVLVMPDVNGGEDAAASQCLDEMSGPKDDTYVSIDVPSDVIATFRVQPQGAHWGIGGYSEGGFCATNLALRHPYRYGAAASMSGYFQPLPERGVDQFGGNPAARLANDPMWLAETHQGSAPVPAFWLMAGSSDRGDVLSAQTMATLLARIARPQVVLVPRVSHTFAAWIPALPQMLAWQSGKLTAGLPPP